MSDARDQERDEGEALAAEYVLGTLERAERQRAEALIRSDAGFAARVAHWEQHFAPLNDAYPEVPAPDLLPVIEARLFGLPAPRRRFAFLRFLAGAGAAAALALAVFIAVDPRPAAPALTATLSATAEPLTFAASYDAATEELTVTHTAGPNPGADSSYELWVIVGTGAPASLGLIDAQTVTRSLPALTPGATLAVSREPLGGSPDGAPTEVLVSGVVTSS
ncbi:anti-sigma factor [Cereibacter changlensis]|nr:anti-sigma factor [Cereibacter changlensis]PZX57420.1 anti-sigma-K factor RskA [Cereibacter changlensis]